MGRVADGTLDVGTVEAGTVDWKREGIRWLDSAIAAATKPPIASRSFQGEV